MSKLKWGIIGAGGIAKAFARGLAVSETGELYAVGSRKQESADTFGDEFNVPRRYAGYDTLLADPDVQAVYISTPHPMHAQWAIRAAEAGKHILCEKPITLNWAETMAVIEAARVNDVFLMEAFMYRCHPQTAKVVELVRDGAVGQVRLIQGAFGFNCGWNPEGRLLNNALGGGGILDVGCYAVSGARLVAGAALGRGFADPIEVKSMGHIGESRVDDYAFALLRFDDDIIAQVATAVQLNEDNSLRIFGTEGNIHVPVPWTPGAESKIIVNRYGKDPEEINIQAYAGLYTLEADVVAANLDKRQAPSPAMSWADTLGNMKTLDSWRAGIGMVYDSERMEASHPPIDGRPLAPRPDNNMNYGKIEGIDKPVSQLVLGVVGWNTFDMVRTSIMYDEFFRSGGNCFDTAYIYGNCDRMLGQWMKNRGNRKDVVVLAKGAHTPHCDPANLTSQLYEILDRMQTDYIDLYVLHRDNPEIPVGEFVDVLNEHKNAGRIRAFGGSNWSIERVQAANDYAASKGLAGLAVVNNQFSLAHMLSPVWDGCISASDPESMAWHKRTQVPLMSWSSLARGFFARGDADDTSDAEMVRCWYDEGNFKRLARAKELAAKHGVSPVVIALAYVIRQPFPTFTLAAPQTLEEMHGLLRALSIELTAEEVKWLNLE